MDTDEHRWERLETAGGFTCLVSQNVRRNLCLSVSICGFASLLQRQLPDLGSIHKIMEKKFSVTGGGSKGNIPSGDSQKKEKTSL